MTQSDAADDIRYSVVKHGDRFRVEDALNPNDGKAIIYPTQHDAQKWATRANERRNKTSGGKTVTGLTEETA